MQRFLAAGSLAGKVKHFTFPGVTGPALLAGPWMREEKGTGVKHALTHRIVIWHLGNLAHEHQLPICQRCAQLLRATSLQNTCVIYAADIRVSDARDSAQTASLNRIQLVALRDIQLNCVQAVQKL